jgi:hypothetical protein
MSTPNPLRPRRNCHDDRRLGASAALACATVLWLAGCASSQLVAQWSDPQFAGQLAQGTKVLVACHTPDLTLRRLCVDRISEQLLAAGVQPLPTPDADGAAADDAALLGAARAAGAAALLRTTIIAETTSVAPAPTIGIGIGGFGGGYRSGGGVGIGMSAPVGGGGPAETGFGASAGLTDVASGKLMWSARASAAPSSDVNRQLALLASQLVEAAKQSGLFAPR